jgi:hypothetical protein
MLRPTHSAVFIILIGSLYLLTNVLYHHRSDFQLKTEQLDPQEKTKLESGQKLNSDKKNKTDVNPKKKIKPIEDQKNKNLEKQRITPPIHSEKNLEKIGFINLRTVFYYSLILIITLTLIFLLYYYVRVLRKKIANSIETVALGSKRGTHTLSKNFQTNLTDKGFIKKLKVASGLTSTQRSENRNINDFASSLASGFTNSFSADQKIQPKNNNALFLFLRFYSKGLSNSESFRFGLRWADLWAVFTSLQLFLLLYFLGINPIAAATGLATLVLINSGLFRQSNLLLWSSIVLNALGAITWAIYGLYETFKNSEPVKINYDFSFNWDISYSAYIIPTVILLITVYLFLKYIKRINHSLSFIFTFLKLLFLGLYKFFARRFQAEAIHLHEINFFICGISFLFFYWILGGFTLFKSSFLIAAIANLILWFISPRETADIEKQWKIDPFKLIIITIGSLIFTFRFYNDADLNIIAYWLTAPVLFTAIFVFIFFKEFDRKALSEKIAENNLKKHEDSLILDLSNKNLNDTDIILRSLDKYTERLTDAGLKSLTISDNNLLFFPPEIFEIKSLEKLNMSNNRIGILSEKLRELPHLKELNLENNRLKSLPLWLAELNALETLNIKGNEIKAEDILQLKNLSPLINIIQ